MNEFDVRGPGVYAAPPPPDRRGAMILALMALGGVLGGAWGVRNMKHRVVPVARREQPVLQPAGLNCRIDLLPGWKQDANLQGQTGTLLALHRVKPEAGLLFWARDFGSREPRPGELRAEASAKLEAWFHNVESNPPVADQLAGQPGEAVVFQGERDGQLAAGELLFCGSKGVGYWLLTWCPATETATTNEEMVAARERLVLLKGREDWQPKARRLSGTGYSLSDEGETWHTVAFPAKEYDAAADLVLDGHEPKVTTRAGDRTRALVLVLPATNEPFAAVKAHVEEAQKKDFPETVVRWQGEPTVGLVGNVDGVIGKATVTTGPDKERFLVVAAVKAGERVIGIVLECEARRKGVWEAEFDRLVASFRVE